MTNEVEKKKLGRTKRTPLDVLRTKLWFGWVWRLVIYGSLSETIKMRWLRSFEQTPGRNKLKPMLG